MARGKRKKKLLSYTAIPHDEWLALWRQRVGYVPPQAIRRGQELRPVTMEGFGTVRADPTLFTPTGPSMQVRKRRHTRRPQRHYM